MEVEEDRLDMATNGGREVFALEAEDPTAVLVFYTAAEYTARHGKRLRSRDQDSLSTRSASP